MVIAPDRVEESRKRIRKLLSNYGAPALVGSIRQKMAAKKILKMEAGVSAEGAKFAFELGRGALPFFDRWLPGRAAKARFKTAIAKEICRKVESGIPVTSEDVRYVRDTCGEAEAKWLRQMQVARRAAVSIEADRVAGLLPPPSGGDPESAQPGPSEDWFSKFWEDAGLVSDETLQEIYSRLLAAEATYPGLCSLRTLRVLRYMDHRTAEGFAVLARGAFAGGWIPKSETLLRNWGISFDLILDLDDAGLVDSNDGLARTINIDSWFDCYGPWVFRADGLKGSMVPMYALREPGIQLLRVAQIEWNQEQFFAVLRHLQQVKAGATVSWAELPHRKWSGNPGDLAWHPVP